MVVAYIPLTIGTNTIGIPLVFDDTLYNYQGGSPTFNNVTELEGLDKCIEWIQSSGFYSKLRFINLPVTNVGWQTSGNYPVSYLADCILSRTPFTPYNFEFSGTAYLSNGTQYSSLTINHTPTQQSSSAGQIMRLCIISTDGYTIERYDGPRNYYSDHGLVKFLVLPSSAYLTETIDSSQLKIFSLSMYYRPAYNYAHIDCSSLSISIPSLNNYNISDLEDERIYNDPFTPNPITGGPGSASSSSSGGDGTGGGWGDFDYSSDGPQDKNPPTTTTYDAGFCTLYAATQAQIKALADYMWADTGDFINNWNKLWANPMDAILGISLVPLSGLLMGTVSAVKVGNISTNVSMTKLSTSIVKVECGSLNITSQSMSHSFMDFPPYNQIQLYLPYIGTVEISAADVIDKIITVSYLCDCLSGACVAFVRSNGYTIATYSGNIAAAVPVTSGDYSNIVFAALDYLKVAGGGMATAAALSMAIPTGGLSAMALPMAVGLGAAGLRTAASQKQKDFEIGHSLLVPQITKGGTAGSIAGYMNHQKPFLIFNAPNIAAPEDMNTYIGYAQYETMSLGSCSGFTKVAEIHYKGAGTEAEREEIENLLRMGVDF